jgi:hypothetical protein
MKKMNLFDKIIASLAGLGFVFWLGGSIIRLITAYDMFEPGTQMLLKNYSLELKSQLIRMYALSAPYTDISFGVLFFASILLFIKFRRELRDFGWLFICLVIIFIMAIPNSYLFWLDYNLATNLFWYKVGADSQAVKDFFFFRFTKLNIIDPMMILSGISIVCFATFQPLKIKSRQNEN